VQPEGNTVALNAMHQVFAVRDQFEWRGLGEIPNSGLKIRPEYAQFDAEVKFTLPNKKVADHKACQCGEILKGVLKPWECKVFGTACTPENPIGTCMVSSEGACAAYYKYGRFSQKQNLSHHSKVTA
jgi:hydrogenase expression/formation protein HypD